MGSVTSAIGGRCAKNPLSSPPTSAGTAKSTRSTDMNDSKLGYRVTEAAKAIGCGADGHHPDV